MGRGAEGSLFLRKVSDRPLFRSVLHKRRRYLALSILFLLRQKLSELKSKPSERKFVNLTQVNERALFRGNSIEPAKCKEISISLPLLSKLKLALETAGQERKWLKFGPRKTKVKLKLKLC